MPIRLSGLTSGLDTEALVGALVSAYSFKKDKYTKAQTKLSWKQDAWKTLNSKVYSLYSSIGNMRYSSNYALRKTSVSDSSKATVTASGDAILGSQTVEIKQLAKTAYITGGELDSTTNEKTTLKELGLVTDTTTGNASIEVRTGTSTKTLQVDGNTTVSEFINKLNGAGVQANFDSTHKRIFVSATKSGAEGEFNISANNSVGLNALKSIGLLTDSEVASLNDDTIESRLSKTLTFTVNGEDNILTKSKDEMKSYVYEVARMAKTLKNNPDDEDAKEYLAEGSKNAKFATYLKERYGEDAINNMTSDSAGEIAEELFSESVYDQHGKDETAREIGVAINAIRDAYVSLEKENLTQEDADAALEVFEKYADWKSYIEENFGNVNSETEQSYSNFWIQSDNKELSDRVFYKVDTSADVAINGTEITSNAKKIDGVDAKFIINNETYSSNSNSITVNGLTVEALALTSDPLNITVSADTDGLYDKVKDFLTNYNNIINEMMKLYNADSAKDYEPLTDDEKAELNETEIEKWEQKIKDSLLRRDSTLSGLITTMTTKMMNVYEINGKNYSWGTLGIGTLGRLRAEKNENYAYHIDGDSEDTYTSGKQDKLRAAIAEDPESVIEFMKSLSTDLYNELDSRMKSTAVKSVYTVYNDKEMASEYSNYSDLIKTWTDRVQDMEDAYYKKFSRMESALATLQGNSSSLSSLLGG